MNNKPKTAVFHAFFRPKGGGEKLVFNLRNYLAADLFTGAIDTTIWDKSKVETDSFIADLYDSKYGLTYFHKDSHLPLWRKIYRQLNLKFNRKASLLNNYDIVFFSGNVAGLAGRLNKEVKKVMYVHTPPRPFTDQMEIIIKKFPKLIRPIYRLFARWVIHEYRQELKNMDVVLSNSKNIQRRLQEYVGVNSQVVYPPIQTNRFKWLDQGDYFLSYARLEDMKRIKIIVEAFAQMPDKKLVICSSGPLKGWIQDQIETRNLTNIMFEGLVSDERLTELVGGCLAGIYIPVQEDFGIIQCELMAAGKPVIGVQEGGLLETVMDSKTGILIPANPSVQDLQAAITKLSPQVALTMKRACQTQAQKFDESVFYQEIDKIIRHL